MTKAQTPNILTGKYLPEAQNPREVPPPKREPTIDPEIPDFPPVPEIPTEPVEPVTPEIPPIPEPPEEPIPIRIPPEEPEEVPEIEPG